MRGRKPKFAGKKTKWEKRRIVKRQATAVQGKKPLVEPLQIAPAAERKAALKRGKMIFYDGKQRLEVPLFLSKRRGNLAGIFRVGGEEMFSPDYVVFRVNWVTRDIDIFGLNRIKGRLVEDERQIGFATLGKDLGHMRVREDLRKRGIALKVVSRAERHVRSGNEGKHQFRLFVIRPGFREIIEKLGFRQQGRMEEYFREKVFLMDKRGKYQERDNFDTHYGFEAIDPKNGKARMFYFPVGKAGKEK